MAFTCSALSTMGVRLAMRSIQASRMADRMRSAGEFFLFASIARRSSSLKSGFTGGTTSRVFQDTRVMGTGLRDFSDPTMPS